MSSILMRNKDVPLFEEHFGQLDYDWLLRVTKDRICKEVSPCVIRYINGENLSLDPDYRKRDFYMGLMEVDGDTNTMKRWFSSRARYHYVMGQTQMARFFFARGRLDWKTILYYFTSYINPLRKFIIKKYRVFGG
jgi:hypothetical protein